MFNRDSLVWWLVVLGSIAGYFATLPPPTQWAWAQWMNAIVVVTGLVAAKLSGSGLAGNTTPAGDKALALGGLLSVYRPGRNT